LIIGLSLLGIPAFARLSRASTLALAEREFVVAARAMGARHRRIMVRELLPNVALPLSSFAFLYMAIVIVAEGSLSFLGLGIPPPQPSWGGMVNDGRPFLYTNPYLVFIPAACLLFTVAAFSVLGDRARRRFDVRESALG
jgi:peptide/nickel transport system permease protein